MDKQEYLALYIGPGGPISVTFEAYGLDDAADFKDTYKRGWFDDGHNDLGLGDGDAIEAALSAGGWEIALRAEHSGDYAIYRQAE